MLSRRVLLRLLSFVLAVAMAGYVTMNFQRNRAIDRIAQQAQERFEGDAVEALLQFVLAPGGDLAERNRAVWALGELRDGRALEALQSLRGSEDCDHAHALCQHELRKAVAKIRGEMPSPWLFG